MGVKVGVAELVDGVCVMEVMVVIVVVEVVMV
jgi:hypothetical protein